MFRVCFLAATIGLMGCGGDTAAETVDPNTLDMDEDGYSVNDGDCDDENSSISPDVVEECDGVDNNCDGEIDEIDAFGSTTHYYDEDGDGYGDAQSSVKACAETLGIVANNDDCDDTEIGAYPGAPEYCDGIDNSCDGVIDEYAVDGFVAYPDADEDGFGDMYSAILLCELTSGYLMDGSDCNDATNSIYPGAPEYCDSYDNDCDGIVDEDDAVNAEVFYLDNDGDGDGDAKVSTTACFLPEGYAETSTDCDDSEPSVYLGAPEYCDALDNDCDTEVDEIDEVVDPETRSPATSR